MELFDIFNKKKKERERQEQLRLQREAEAKRRAEEQRRRAGEQRRREETTPQSTEHSSNENEPQVKVPNTRVLPTDDEVSEQLHIWLSKLTGHSIPEISKQL